MFRFIAFISENYQAAMQDFLISTTWAVVIYQFRVLLVILDKMN